LVIAVPIAPAPAVTTAVRPTRGILRGHHGLTPLETDRLAMVQRRVRRAGEVFTMTLTHDGAIRENHVVEFEEGRRIAWRVPAPRPRSSSTHMNREPAGHSDELAETP
jgi:hypothetical protein